MKKSQFTSFLAHGGCYQHTRYLAVLNPRNVCSTCGAVRGRCGVSPYLDSDASAVELKSTRFHSISVPDSWSMNTQVIAIDIEWLSYLVLMSLWNSHLMGSVVANPTRSPFAFLNHDTAAQASVVSSRSISPIAAPCMMIRVALAAPNLGMRRNWRRGTGWVIVNEIGLLARPRICVKRSLLRRCSGCESCSSS